jgi:hypothetical protein
MEQILDRLAALEAAQQRQQAQVRALARQLRFWRGAALGLLFLVLAGGTIMAAARPLAAQAAEAQGILRPGRTERRLRALEQSNAQQDDVLKFFSAEGNDIFITGANLHLVNGLGATNGNPAAPQATDPGMTTVNGLGNLIIGYNESRGPLFGGDHRDGSHNLVMGTAENFTSFGGIVAGRFGTISAAEGSVLGGVLNNANGVASVISGGQFSTAPGFTASVSGGVQNHANGTASSVTGGLSNVADGTAATVSGGDSRSAPNQSNWRAGALFQAF